jgi:hypothetical protein
MLSALADPRIAAGRPAPLDDMVSAIVRVTSTAFPRRAHRGPFLVFGVVFFLGLGCWRG